MSQNPHSPQGEETIAFPSATETIVLDQSSSAVNSPTIDNSPEEITAVYDSAARSRASGSSETQSTETRVMPTPSAHSARQSTVDDATRLMPASSIGQAQEAEEEVITGYQSQPVRPARPTAAPAPAAAYYAAAQQTQRMQSHSQHSGPLVNHGIPVNAGSQMPYRVPLENTIEGAQQDQSLRYSPSVSIIFKYVCALIFFAAATWASLHYFVMTASGQAFDERSFIEFQAQFTEYQASSLKALDSLPAAVGVIAVIALAMVLIFKHRFLPALVGIGAATMACASTFVLKHYLITKPDFGIQDALNNSSPSGHTTFAAAAGTALLVAAPRAWRPTVAFFASIATFVVGVSTIINGWHRPGDIISAILVTAFWTVFAFGLLRYIRPEDFNVPSSAGIVIVPLLSIATLFMSFCAVVMFLITQVSPMPGGAFAAGTCMILAINTGATAICIGLLRPRNRPRSVYTRVWSY